MSNNHHKAYIITVDMGYGHQRAAHPLFDISASPVGWNESDGVIITANNYQGIPERDKKIWNGGRSLYEKISRLKHLPLVGNGIFKLMDYMQRIEPYYPKHDLRGATLQLKEIYGLIEKGWGKHLIDTLNKNPLPIISTFFSTAFFAEEHGYQGEIFCLCTDADISRAWAPLHPEQTRINYLAPNPRVKDRLIMYGVPEKNIIITGFPMPKENIGPGAEILKRSIGRRICVLDPDNRYRQKHEQDLEYYLGKQYCVLSEDHRLTITFAVGGAGAQRELGVTILNSLKEHIIEGRIRLNLVAGSRQDVYRYYADACKEYKLNQNSHVQVNIIYDENKYRYFEKFNRALLTTDILWTKPSELSFFASLGLPIIIAPPIGSQEDFNREWLQTIGAGIDQEDPEYTHEWLFDWLASGWLAEAAMEGFIDAPHAGAYRIADVVFEGKRDDLVDTQLF